MHEMTKKHQVIFPQSLVKEFKQNSINEKVRVTISENFHLFQKQNI